MSSISSSSSSVEFRLSPQEEQSIEQEFAQLSPEEKATIEKNAEALASKIPARQIIRTAMAEPKRRISAAVDVLGEKVDIINRMLQSCCGANRKQNYSLIKEDFLENSLSSTTLGSVLGD